MPVLFQDGNNEPVSMGLRPTPSTSGIISATLTNATQELTLPTAGANAHGEHMYRIASLGQPLFYALGVAGASASFTGITNMQLLPANWVEYVKANSQDVSIYVLQAATGGSVQISVEQ